MTETSASPALPHAALATLVGRDLADATHGPLNEALDYCGARTPLRVAHFLAQYLHETQGLTRLSENLNYTTPERIRAIFPSRFPSVEAARPYVRNPEKLANRVYAGRLGNGDEASGDGWRFRGRGLCHLTGRANYAACARATGRPEILADPDQVAQPALAALAGAEYWKRTDCNTPAGRDDLRGVTTKVNGPALAGLQDRADWLLKVKRALGVRA